MLATALATALLASTAHAASVKLDVSTRETYVGIPVTVQVTIENVSQHDPPVFPEIANATMRSAGPPSTQTQVQIINGVRSQSSTLIYNFELTPTKPGNITIPAITINADGQSHSTSQMVILVSKSETGDLLFVELKGSRPSMFVGESLEITLQIWIKPFTSPQYNYTFNEDQMLGRLDTNKTQWGPFEETLRQMSNQRRRPVGSSVMRKDSQGVEHNYYLYELKRTFWPERPGTLNVGDINVWFMYPTRIGPGNNIFAMGQLAILDHRPISGSAKVDPIVIKTVPMQGRPPYYRDAVGQYQINASAKPIEVAVGDPITLTLNISGNGKLESLQPPPLADIEELTRDFKVPADPLSGTVNGNLKQFAQSIRAKSAAVRAIPPIPFAYFDPRQEKFITVRSQPIPITVKAGEKLSMSQIVEADGERKPVARQLTENTGGILANYSDMDEVLSQQAFAPGWATAVTLAAPPMLFAVCWLTRRRSERLRVDVSFARRRSARRSALHRIRGIKGNDAAAAAGTVAEALSGYVADRCNLPPGGLTRAEVVHHLTDRRVGGATIAQIDELLQRCESLRYAGWNSSTADELMNGAVRGIDQLERERF